MKGYFDVHCHLLPGIDDGAADEKEMLEMLEVAYREGIRHIFVTPHYHPKRGEADAAVINRIFDDVQNIVKTRFPDLTIYRGNEIYFRQDATEMLKNGKLLTLADSDYVLIEFSTSAGISQIKNAVGQIQMAGYLPVVAHVERYEELIGQYQVIEELADAGVYFQVNAASVIGNMGGARKRFIKKMIKNGWVHLIGTDAHDARYRAPLMKKCASYLQKKFDDDTAEVLLYDNPSMIVENKVI